MELFVTIRKMDETGRVNLPQEFLKELDWQPKDELLVAFNKDSSKVVLSLYKKNERPRCVFCNSLEAAIRVGGGVVCVKCAEAISNRKKQMDKSD